MNRENPTMSKVKVTFVLPETLQRDLKEQVVKDGYDLKGKSRWVGEAIKMLLMNQNYPDLVKLSDEMNGFEKQESVILDRPLKIEIADAALTIRKKYPALEGIQSRIVRTAIVQRLLRQEKLSHLTFN